MFYSDLSPFSWIFFIGVFNVGVIENKLNSIATIKHTNARQASKQSITPDDKTNSLFH